MSSVAFSGAWLKMPRMKEALLTAFLGVLLGSGMAWAAPADTPPPPPPPNADNPNRPGPPDRDRDHRPRFPQSGDRQAGFLPREGDHGDSFRHLSEEDRQKVRNAFEKAWKNPQVIQAREQLMKANDQYREALHQALTEVDPEVTKILDKMKTDGPQGGHRMNGPMPDVADPEFAHKMVQRLVSDLQGWAQGPGPGDRGPGERGEGVRGDRMERHEPSPQMMRIHERLMQVPAVTAALKELEQSEPGHKMEAWKHLRDAYQAAAKMEIAKLREGARLSEPPPSGSPPPPPPPDAGQPK